LSPFRPRAARRSPTAPALLTALLATGAALGCGEPAAPAAEPLVAVSVLPQQYFVDRLGGGAVRSVVMVPPGASPALYDPTLAQLADLEEAVAYFEVGHPAFPFERAWLDRLLAGREDLERVDTSAGIASPPGDPHVWLAPAGAQVMARNTAAALARLLPEEAEAVEERLRGLEAEIRAVDAELRERLAPVRGRTFFVFHPAWGALARAYGLEQVAVEHDHKEPDPRQLARLVRRARESGARAIFVQPQFSRRAAEVVAREVGADVIALDPLAYDWPSNLREVGRTLAEALAP